MYKLAFLCPIFVLFTSLIISAPEIKGNGKEVKAVKRMETESAETVDVYLPIRAISPIVIESEVKEKQLSNEDIALIALVTMAEAEGECEEGKRLVIDTILNRMDSTYFPDTVSEVVYQPHQFSSMWNSRVERCEVRGDICQLVREELEARTNYEVMFFTAGNYGRYGVPIFQVENHYFSSYE